MRTSREDILRRLGFEADPDRARWWAGTVDGKPVTVHVPEPAGPIGFRHLSVSGRVVTVRDGTGSLSVHPDTLVAAVRASRRDTPADILDGLWSPSLPTTVQVLVAVHPNASVTLMERVACEGDTDARTALAGDSRITRAAAEALADDRDPRVTAAVAGNPTVPDRIRSYAALRSAE